MPTDESKSTASALDSFREGLKRTIGLIEAVEDATLRDEFRRQILREISPDGVICVVQVAEVCHREKGASSNRVKFDFVEVDLGGRKHHWESTPGEYAVGQVVAVMRVGQMQICIAPA